MKTAIFGVNSAWEAEDRRLAGRKARGIVADTRLGLAEPGGM